MRENRVIIGKLITQAINKANLKLTRSNFLLKCGDIRHMMYKIKQLFLATWQYLNQPIFEQQAQAVWKPSRFWYLYKIQLLERCLSADIGSQSHYTQ